jgi:hypothetical protein
LQSLGDENLLDEKLAEYAFFPLTHIFNASRRLSSPVLEIAVRSVQILVSRGWRDKLLPEMAKQLLILMGLLVSSTPGQQSEPASDEVKVACFDCISVLVAQTARLGAGVLEGLGEKNVVDQVVYQLLEAITETASENVQISAAHALRDLNSAINNPVLLASLMPRTVSTLVKVLRPSTRARRTRKVLVAYLQLLTVVLKRVLADEVVYGAQAPKIDSEQSDAKTAPHTTVLDKSWLDATTPQIDLALVQVVKLRTQEDSDISQALLDLCLLVIEDCAKSLERSLPLMVETLVLLGRSAASSDAESALRHLVISRPEISEILDTKFYEWSQVLPRVMQGNDDRPKQQMLGQIAISFAALADAVHVTDELTRTLATVLVDGVSAAINSGSTKSKLIDEAPRITTTDLVQQSQQSDHHFAAVVLGHQSQQSSTKALQNFVASLQARSFSAIITRSIVDQTQVPDTTRRLSATWLALNFLQSRDGDFLDMEDFIMVHPSESDASLSRPFLISDLYALTLPNLLQYSHTKDDAGADWRLVALSLECLILQASQLGQSYRPELMETLFPLLTLLGSSNATLQRHAMTALNCLASACEYDSAAQMLVENVDYLVNALAIRLNTFDVSQDGLQVLAMMLRLCGARLLPHLDDLIGSIFAALDNFHGYPGLVERLFEILKTMVEESSEDPALLAIEPGPGTGTRQSRCPSASTVEDIVNDLRARKSRKSKSDGEHGRLTSAPHHPWTSSMNEPKPGAQEVPSDDDPNGDGEEPLEKGNRDLKAKLSKPHQLLLNIAQSTVPHMSSPSSKVRLTLLELLQEICPLLGRDENSFQPLVNSVWPAIVSRLLTKMEDVPPEVPYNIQAAAEAMSVICRAAGDFMASRIEDIFLDLEALFKKICSAALPSMKPKISSTSGDMPPATLVASHSHRTVPDQLQQTSVTSHKGLARTSAAQILNALIGLFVSILQTVRISEDNADRIFDMLGPLMGFSGMGAVRGALNEYNPDAVWLLETCRDG